MIAVNLFTYSRYFASKALVAKLETDESTPQGTGQEPQLVRKVTEESMEKFIQYTNRRGKIGGRRDDESAEEGPLKAAPEPVKPAPEPLLEASPEPPKVAAEPAKADLLDYCTPEEGERVKTILNAPSKCASLRDEGQ